MLFNKRLLQSHLNNFEYPQGYDFERVEKIIDKWQESIQNGNYDRTKETQVQASFLHYFFNIILGYTEMHDNSETWHLINEAKTELDGTKADGALGYFTKDEKSNVTRAVIELKDAKTHLAQKQSTRKDYDSPISQAFSYSSKFDRCDWIIVSNFKEIRLYNKERGQGYFESFEILNLKDEKEFKRFYFLLCKQNLLDKNRKSLLDNLVTDTTKNEEEITKEFYKDFKTLRQKLFQHICEHNPNIDKKLLLVKTQKLLDRLIFIMFCEDSKVGLLQHKTLENYYKMGQQLPIPSDEKITTIFKGLFQAIDKGSETPRINAYNGGLFKVDNDLDNLIIKDSAWKGIIDLANYDFDSDLNVNVLGHIFEQSLSDLEQIKAEIDGIEQDKNKSKRKKDGIFYTPEYITRYIVEQTVYNDLEESPDKLETIKILDPACGSGAFINQAHTFLKEQYKIRTEEKIDNERASKRGGEEFLQVNMLKHTNVAETDRSILLNNLYGVDLNEESTEITKLALWLKTAKSDQPLQNLDNNIKCGNSLIDDATIAGYKAFNWHEQFKAIMDNGGFDCIIGNPPYVFTRTQEYEENMKLYFQNYLCSNNIIKEQKGKNIQSGKLNLYTWFIIKSIELLKDGGVLGFIIPNGILRTTTYDLVRKFILDNTKILQIVDMGAGVFEGVTASTVILILEKNNNTDCCHNNDINVITNVENLLLKQFTSYKIKQLDFLNNTSFAFNIFVDSDKQNVNEKINNNAVYLGEICKYISPGIDGDQEKYVSKIKETEKHKPLLYGKNIGKYSIHGNDNYILYDRALLNRARSEEIYLSEKIVLQRISGGTSPIHACIDRDNYYTFNSVNNIVLKPESNYNLAFLLALLNSKLLNWYYANNFSNNSNLTVNISKTFLEKLPIVKATTEQQENLIKMAEKMLELNKLMQKDLNLALELIQTEYSPKNISRNLENFYTLGVHPFLEELEKQGVKLSLSKKEELLAWYKQKSEALNNIKSQIDTLNHSIDQEVYKLYNLTPEEIQIIEGA